MSSIDLPVVLPVVQQHAEEAAILKQVRTVLLRSPHVQLHRLRRLDDRIAAHLDGVLLAGEAGMAVLASAMAAPTSGVAFTLAVCALRARNRHQWGRLVAVAEALPDVATGLLAGLGWVSSDELQGTVGMLLASKVPSHRVWGLAACAMHRVDPGNVLAQAVQDPDEQVRARAWRVAAQLGRRDLADAAKALLLHESAASTDEHATVLITPGAVPERVGADRRAAAWALTLWGMGRSDPVRAALMAAAADQGGLPRHGVHRLAVLASTLDWARDQVRTLAAQAESSAFVKRRMMRLAAWMGDPQAIPWLIQCAADDKWARLAGECFTLVTGVDLAAENLDRPAGSHLPQTGPNDDPDHDDVALDEDDSLPWPDASRLHAWWQAHGGRYEQGRRYFMGAPPDVAHVLGVLRQGGQRQRIMAAEYLCLLRPGEGLFPVAAPAWRQSRWLADMQRADVA